MFTLLNLIKSKSTAAVAVVVGLMLTATQAFAAPGDYISGDPSDGAILDFATDVATFALTVVLPAVLVAMAAGAALRLIFRAVRRVTGAVG